MKNISNKNIIILGGGPSGYSAAFRCADLNLKTIIIEKNNNQLGGVCLHKGCIPSKALLHITKIIEELKNLKKNGVIFNKINLNLKKIKTWKNNTIKKINNNLIKMAKYRKIKIIQGTGKILNNNYIIIKKKNNIKNKIKFNKIIIATGSKPIKFKLISKKDPKIWNSTDALKLKYIPKNMLIIGGGIIGLEMSNIYKSLGSNIDIIETSNQILPNLDKDISNIFTNQLKKKINIILNGNINKIKIKKKYIYVNIKINNKFEKYKKYDTILVAIGRKPNINNLKLNKLNILINKKGFININKKMNTNISNIYAIGDVTGQPMLAHKGMNEGHIAAEVIYGKNHFFTPKIIPCISYTNPELAWVGISEKNAIKKKINYEIAIFPWIASGRAIVSNCQNGITKLIFNKKTNKLIGGFLIGINSGELLGEISLAIEMGCNAEDIELTIHAHPTLYETINMSAKIYQGTITDFKNNKKLRY